MKEYEIELKDSKIKVYANRQNIDDSQFEKVRNLLLSIAKGKQSLRLCGQDIGQIATERRLDGYLSCSAENLPSLNKTLLDMTSQADYLESSSTILLFVHVPSDSQLHNVADIIDKLVAQSKANVLFGIDNEQDIDIYSAELLIFGDKLYFDKKGNEVVSN